MYLKSLELHGFKSFPNRTVLTFERGATVIVGPNGSGKSNISDAMRWVLGELSSRNIRGTKMEDVIFGGTDERKKMGFAEVSVTFDNSDPENRLDSEFDEVVVTRRYYRTGESEYLINRQPKRLKDIYELFMNTGVGREGYSIVGQGKIAEIISKKSDDRRSIFEEAAGISKYRHRKEESERKLKNTQDNLDRVKDILFELESQIGPLEKDAEKARKGLALYEEKKRADVSLWLYDTKQIRTDIEKAQNALKLSQHELDVVDRLIEELNARYESLSEKSQNNKAEASRVYEQIRITNEKIHNLEMALQKAEGDFAHSSELIAQCNARIADLERNIENVLKGKSEQEERRSVAETAYEKIMAEKLEYLVEREKIVAEITEAKKFLQDALLDLTAEENEATSLKVRINVLENSSSEDGTKSQDLVSQIEKYRTEGVALKEESDRCEANASVYKEQIDSKTEAIDRINGEIEELTKRRTEEQNVLGAYKLQRNEYLQKADIIQRMNDHFEGYVESVRFVMKEYNEGRLTTPAKIHGPLSTLISVEKKYITAIETAIGGSMQNIVVDDEATAKSAIYALKRASAGRATFYPISAIKPLSETEEIRKAANFEGYVGRADTLINTKDKYRNIVQFLLLRTLVFDNIDNASVAAKALNYKVKIVTLDGQLIAAGGSFTGGSAKKETGILSRVTDINNLKEKAKAFDVKIAETEEIISHIGERLSELKNEYGKAEEEKEILLVLSRTQFAALDNANAKYSANRDILEKLTSDYERLVSKQSFAEEEIVRLTSEYNAALERAEAIKEIRSDRAEKMGVLEEHSEALGTKISETLIKAAEAKKDVESIDQMIATIDERLNELYAEKEAENSRIDDIVGKRSTIDQVKEENRTERDMLGAELKMYDDRRRALDTDSDEYDRTLSEIQKSLQEKHSSRDVCYDAVSRDTNLLERLESDQVKLGAKLWDDYEMSYEEAVALEYPAVTAENREEVARIQSSARAKLRALGGYNPDAIEQYAEVKMRYDGLNTQYQDLTKSYEELTDIISRLEEEMRTSFVTAFEAINKNFGITFKELFGGGNAELVLVEPEDVLTSGIEIKAAPPGKIIKSLSLLSGGEQSFVAIALLFAILKVNPTPFCILDEIEAALDEVNVFRFGEYIKRLADGTQFILITHRRGTMEIGDRLYGVTMPQRGISQAIELNVNEIEGKQKELLDGVL